jgi:hypothetical protein
MMPDETYFVVQYDNPRPSIDTPCVTGPGNDLDFYSKDEKQDALDRRDELRDRFDNPDINVYRMTIHEGHVERGEGEPSG